MEKEWPTNYALENSNSHQLQVDVNRKDNKKKLYRLGKKKSEST